VLKSALGAGIGLSFSNFAAHAAENPKKIRPQTGDVLVFSSGGRLGQIVTPQDVPLGGPPVLVYPMESATQTVRDGSRLNRVLLVRFAPEALSESTRAYAAEGVVGYSAICTHTGCDVAGWQEQKKQLVCPCHTSTFDAKDRALVVSGPAPRPLPMLPLWLVNGQLTVAGAFAGRVGAAQ
jgi:Rieske Fe-S protein